VRDGALYEVKSAIILQPGPAALTDGLAEIRSIIARWVEKWGRSPFSPQGV
jgi:iron complex transport system substrate-binding protein